VANPDAKGSLRRDSRPVETRRGETELILSIDLDADPITGSLRAPHGPSRRFSGWIGLAATLETLRADAAKKPRPTPDDRAR
jgi:hypothetical protein